jgi:hypothetical protein
MAATGGALLVLAALPPGAPYLAIAAAFAASAAQSPGDPAAVAHGFRVALLVGAVGELSGAAIALRCIRAGALQGRAAAE